MPVTPERVPATGSLADVSYRSRHGIILSIAFLHAVTVPLVAIRSGRPVAQIVAATFPVAVAAALAAVPAAAFPRRFRSASAGLSLAAASVVLIHLMREVPEAQLHIFVVIPILALYQDWLPVGIAFATDLIHTGVIAVVQPEIVFGETGISASPLRSVVVHASFVAAESLVCMFWWRIHSIVLARQHVAELELRAEKQVAETLHSIGTGVVAELDMGRVAQLVTDEAVTAIGAQFGAFFYNVADRSGERYLLYTLSGAPRSAFESFPMPRNTKVFEPTFTGNSVVRIDDVLVDPRYGQNAPYHGMPQGHLPVRSYLAVPVRSRGSSEVLGGLFFGHEEPARFGDQEERLAVGIATQAAIAFDNARLYQAERSAHEMAAASQERLALLGETGRLISSAFDQNVTLREIARLTVPTLADACLIDMPSDDGKILRIAAGGPGLERYAQALVPFPPGYDDLDHPIIQVMRSGESLFVKEIDAEFLDRITRLPKHRQIAEELNPRSTIIVPLSGRDRVYGSITLINVGASGRLFGSDDFALAEEIGRRAGMALENAKLYNQQRTVAESLQHALLPQQLPSITGFEATARYLPGSPGERIGGDWYDLFEVRSGEIAIVMGDVVGHGIAAASLMAQLRNGLRAYVWDGLAPSEVLAHLNQLLYGLEPEGMATVTIGLLDPITARLRIANAGHLPPLRVRDRDGTFFGEGLGPPLGAVPFAHYREIEMELRPGDTAIFYTDGLIEDRSLPLDAGLDRMRSAIVDASGTIDEACDAMVAQCLGDRIVEDDVAVLMLRSVPLGDTLSLRLPTQPRVLASLRQTLRRWLHENGIGESETQDVLIACGEACNNAIEHGTGSLRNFFQIEASIGDEMRFVVRNEGGWREPRDDGGGRGLQLIRALMDDVEIVREPAHTEVRMRRCVKRAEPAA